MARNVDVAILGGGNGGYAAALRAASLGLSVTLVEKDKVGGTCLHRGCIPTKALLHAAEVRDQIERAGDFGILTSGVVEVDWGQVSKYKDSVVSRLHKGLEGIIKGRKVEIVKGAGRLAGPNSIEFEGGEGITASKGVVLASGSFAKSLPFIEIDGKTFITSDHALQADEIPASVVVIGAGAVGLEFASIYRSFGAEVTVLEALDRLAPGEDEEISKDLARQFQKRGIKGLAGVKVTEAQTKNGKAQVTYESGGKTQTATVDVCLVAVGRGAVSEGLGYEEAGVRLGRGFVVVDGGCRTGVEGVWAVGDLVAQPDLGLPSPHFQLAHVAFAEGIHVAEQIAGLESVPVNYIGVPRCTYSHPEIASVGLTEAQAKDAGFEVEATKFAWSASGKAMILGETTGFTKVVTEKGGKVLGVHMIGPRVTELIAEAQLITNWEAFPPEVASLLHPHPTLSEAIGESMLHLAGKQLHGA